MLYCYECGSNFETPKKIYEKHCLDTQPYEVLLVCPFCKSSHISEENTSHCRCCGSKLPLGRREYCSKECEEKGKTMWEKQRRKKKKALLNPLNLTVKELENYNKTQGTNLSYGEYVSLKNQKKGRKNARR